LPKWAQEHMRLLESLASSAEKRLADYTNHEPTLVMVDPYSDSPLYLPDYETIRFDVGGSTRNIDVQMGNSSKLILRGSYRSIMVHPVASNVVEVYLAD